MTRVNTAVLKIGDQTLGFRSPVAILPAGGGANNRRLK
jgi:hypothetical protein